MTYEDNFDVVLEGAGTERGARVLAAKDGLYINQHEVPYETLLGVALRGSILLVVGTQSALALRGGRDGLATLAAELRRHADLGHLAALDREELEGERVVFSTPVAMSGTAEMEKFKGMSLAVVTDARLHLLDRTGRRVNIEWPMVTRLDSSEAKFGRLLKIGSGTTDLDLLYLTDAQIQTIRGLVARHAGWLLSGGAARAGSQRAGGPGVAAGDTESMAEGATGGAATEPVPAAEPEDPLRRFTVPEFEHALGGVGSGSDRPLGATVDRIQMSPILPVGFLDEHLRELRTLYNGVLLRRKREAAAADRLPEAAAALDGEPIWEDVRETVGVMAEAMRRALERQARRVAANRRMPWRQASKRYMPTEKEMVGLRQRLARGLAPLEEPARVVTRVVAELRAAAQAGPEKLRPAYEAWQMGLRELDEAYAVAWSGIAREVAGIWKDIFLPRLNSLAGQRRRLLPWPVRAALYFVALALAVGAVYLFLTGGLENVWPIR